MNAFGLVAIPLLAFLALTAAPDADAQTVPGGDPHPPIRIVGDAGFADPRNGVRSGTGTAADPYMIEGWNVTGTYEILDDLGPSPPIAGQEAAIQVLDTTKSFVIRDVAVQVDRLVPLEGPVQGSASLRYGIAIARSSGNVTLGKVLVRSGGSDDAEIYVQDAARAAMFNVTADIVRTLRVDLVTVTGPGVHRLEVYDADRTWVQGAAFEAGLLAIANHLEVEGSSIIGGIQLQDGMQSIKATGLSLRGSASLMIRAAQAEFRDLEVDCAAEAGFYIESGEVTVQDATLTGCSEALRIIGGTATLRRVKLDRMGRYGLLAERLNLTIDGLSAADRIEQEGPWGIINLQGALTAKVRGLEVACMRNPCVTMQGANITIAKSMVHQALTGTTGLHSSAGIDATMANVTDSTFVGGHIALSVKASASARLANVTAHSTELGIRVHAPDLDVGPVDVHDALFGVSVEAGPGGVGRVHDATLARLAGGGISTGRGLREAPPKDILVERNVIEGSRVGILAYAENTRIFSNVIQRPTLAGVYVGADDVRVEGNAIEGPGVSGIQVGKPLGESFDDLVRRPTIVDNEVIGSGRAGIELAAQGAVVRGNKVEWSVCADLVYGPVELNPDVEPGPEWTVVALRAADVMDWDRMCLEPVGPASSSSSPSGSSSRGTPLSMGIAIMAGALALALRRRP